jgi:homoserine acetyltransferase
MKVTRIMWYAGTVFTTLAMLAGSANVAAQQLASSAHAKTAVAREDSVKVDRRRAANLKAFRGIAAKLNTSPEALQSAFERARQSNPKLSRGNFIAANVLADNLGARRPNVTTAAILSGLQNGNSIGETLQSLGLSKGEAKSARKAADRRIKDGDQRVKDEDRRSRAREAERKQREREESGHNR